MKLRLVILVLSVLILHALTQLLLAQQSGVRSQQVPIVTEKVIEKGKPADTVAHPEPAQLSEPVEVQEPMDIDENVAEPTQPVEPVNVIDYDKFTDDNKNGIDDRFEKTEKQKVKVQEAGGITEKEKSEKPKN